MIFTIHREEITSATRRANAVAFDIREKGRPVRVGNQVTGKIALDEKGNEIWTPGTLKACKAIGWFIEEYGVAQVSINLTDITITPLHAAFEEASKKAVERGLRVTGSELVGMVPLKVMLDAGKYFLKKQGVDFISYHADLKKPEELIDFIDKSWQGEIPYTSGNLYFSIQNKLTRYPIPECRLPQGNGERLLDIGCNWGRWSIAAAQKGYRPVGIDPSLDAVLAARRVSRQLGVETVLPRLRQLRKSGACGLASGHSSDRR